MDPFKVTHEHVHDLILQHFSLDEILDFSIVSKFWYATIGKSNQTMTKVWLNVGDRFNEPKKEDLRAFRASERNYQNFKMSEIESGLQILLFPSRQWKGAQIDIQSFTTYKDYINLLKIFNKSIVELDLFDMDIEYVDSDDNTLEFTQLKILRIGFVTSIALKTFIHHLPKLEKLKIDTLTDLGAQKCDTASELMVKFLKLQPQITHLSLSSEAFNKLFDDEATFDFQLTFLFVDYAEKGETKDSRRKLENFEKFVLAQKHLRWITLCEWMDIKSVSAIFKHERLDRISFDYFDDLQKLDSSLLKLRTNFGIKRIDFDCENVDLCWLRPFLEAVPNIEVCYFFHVTKDLFQFLISNFKKMRFLRYCSIFENYSEYYNNLKSQNVESINYSAEIIEDKFIDLRKLI